MDKETSFNKGFKQNLIIINWKSVSPQRKKELFGVNIPDNNRRKTINSKKLKEYFSMTGQENRGWEEDEKSIRKGNLVPGGNLRTGALFSERENKKKLK